MHLLRHRPVRTRAGVGRAVAVLALGALLAARLVAGASPAAADGGTYTVNATGDAGTAAARTACRTALVGCTLRAALLEDQADLGPSRIEFGIPGAGPHTITIGSALPSLAAGDTTVDGYTQSGASVNTSADTSNAVLRVQVQGSGPTGPDAFVITSARNRIAGLAVYNVRQPVRLSGSTATGNVLAGNFLGTDAAGTFGYARFDGNAIGIAVRSAANGNTIGGPSAADRNVISGNGGRGIYIGAVPLDPGTDDNVVEGNLIGLNPAGTARRSNHGHGIDVNAAASRNRLLRNVVSGNNGTGIEISHGIQTVDNEIVGNRVGTDPSGTRGPAYARNSQLNVRVEDGPRRTLVSDNVIGNNAVGGLRVNGLTDVNGNTRIVSETFIEDNRIGVSLDGTPIPNGPYGVAMDTGAVDNVVGPGNEIAHNQIGVRLIEDEPEFRVVRNTITANSIHSNTGLGIDIQPLGQPNPNDAGDGDAGPNDSLNWPVITGTTATSVSGTACGSCRVEVFEADAGATVGTNEPSSFGEGRTLLGTATAASDGSFTVPVPGASGARIVSATATSSRGTSEFGRNATVPASGTIAIDGFSRTVTGGWGSADVGGPWTPAASPTSFAVNGSAGTIDVAAGAERAITLSEVSAAGVDAAVTVAVDRLPATGSSQTVAIVTRRRSEGSYRSVLRVAGDGSVRVGVERVLTSGGTTVLAEEPVPGLTVAPGTRVRLRTDVKGADPTTIRVRAWAAGTTEPGDWTATATDGTAALQQAGALGVAALSTGAFVVTVDDLDARAPAGK